MDQVTWFCTKLDQVTWICKILDQVTWSAQFAQGQITWFRKNVDQVTWFRKIVDQVTWETKCEDQITSTTILQKWTRLCKSQPAPRISAPVPSTCSKIHIPSRTAHFWSTFANLFVLQNCFNIS